MHQKNMQSYIECGSFNVLDFSGRYLYLAKQRNFSFINVVFLKKFITVCAEDIF